MTIPGEHRKITVVDATHLAAPITELEQARAHLRVCQDHLEHCRSNIAIQTYQDQRDIWRSLAKAAEVHIFAALSWVWDAQERDAAWRVWSDASKLAYALCARIPDLQTLPIGFEHTALHLVVIVIWPSLAAFEGLHQIARAILLSERTAHRERRAIRRHQIRPGIRALRDQPWLVAHHKDGNRPRMLAASRRMAGTPLRARSHRWFGMDETRPFSHSPAIPQHLVGFSVCVFEADRQAANNICTGHPRDAQGDNGVERCHRHAA